jgi:PAS domain S-box-containing protein
VVKLKIENNIKFKIKFALVCSTSLFGFEFLLMTILKKFPAPSYFIGTIIDASAVAVFAYFFIYNYLIKDFLKQEEKLNLEFLRHKNSLDRTASISETDTNGIITSVNDLLCKISGYREDELIGQPHKILNSKSHSSEFWKGFWETITSGKVWKGEICNIAKDGTLYWVDATVIPNLDIEGKITGYTAVRIDITQRKESQRQMEHKAKLASIGEMAAGVGHEINNPLAISTGNISIIKKIIESDNIDIPRIGNAIKKNRTCTRENKKDS